MTPTCAERFCQEQISELVQQIREPKTGKPEEIPELVAELVEMMDKLRAVEAVRMEA